MSNFTNLIVELLKGGLVNLAAYIAAHVLLCLLPAFYIAGAMTALIPKETVTRFLGRSTQYTQIHFVSRSRAGGVHAGGLFLYDRASVRGYLQKKHGTRSCHYLPILRPCCEHSCPGVYRRSHRDGFSFCPPVPFADLWHRHRVDHGNHIPQRSQE